MCACCRWVAKLRSYMAFQASKKAPSVAVKLTDLYNLETMRTVLWPLQKHFPQHGPYLGVYAQVVGAGAVRVGDQVVLP